jgi:hypothetical protein
MVDVGTEIETELKMGKTELLRGTVTRVDLVRRTFRASFCTSEEASPVEISLSMKKEGSSWRRSASETSASELPDDEVFLVHAATICAVKYSLILSIAGF